MDFLSNNPKNPFCVVFLGSPFIYTNSYEYIYIVDQSQIEYLGPQKQTKILIQTKIYINLVIPKIQ